MRKTVSGAAACVTCFLAILSQPASGRQIEPLSFVVPWSGGAFANDQTGQFSACIASATYKSGITMTVMINRAGNWLLGFGDPAWNLQPDTEIPLSITFDGQSPWTGTAKAFNAHMTVVPMALTSTLINSFRGAYQMQIQAAGRTFAFNLGGTSRLMVQLDRCVETQLAIERGEPPPQYAEAPARPLNPTTAPAPAAQPETASLELEATRIASNLLLQANLPHAHLLTSAETPPQVRGRGAAWMSDDGLGAVEIVSAAVGMDANQVASQLVASDGASCKGDFASGRSSDLLDDKVITKAFTGCKDSGGTRAYRYFIVQAAASDFIVYALTDKGGAPPASGNAPTSDARFQAAAVKAAFSQ